MELLYKIGNSLTMFGCCFNVKSMDVCYWEFVLIEKK